MGRYRLTIPIFAANDRDPAKVLRFSAKVAGNSAAEARMRGIDLYRELGSASGRLPAKNLTESDVYVDEADPHAQVLIEIGALEVTPGVVCMSLVGPLDSATALRLDREVYNLQHHGARMLSIDVGKVHPFTSAGLGVLLSINDRLDVRLVKMPATARTLLATLGLDSNLSVYNSFPEALVARKDRAEQG
ncbi:MAG: STAS domain-containing protein [Planctomycetota bacterium]|nr:STAS domain-containing protein [Planctomycetota bacterium]